jgi:radical SAM-linked protein
VSDNVLVAAKFRIWGVLRFLSHAETIRVFQRAFARAGFELAHSQGFNPRPRLSLPLPRSVGVATDDDLLCARIKAEASSFDAERFLGRLSAQLPQGCSVVSAQSLSTRQRFEAAWVTYVLTVGPQYSVAKLKTRIERVLASDSLELQRTVDARGRLRKVDVRGYLESIELKDRDVVVRCCVSSAGSIRVEEILSVLGLEVDQLAGAVRRTCVTWRQYGKN